MLLMEYKGSIIQSDINNPMIKKVVKFINENPLDNIEKGIHTVSNDFFYNIIEMDTTTEENREWESHKDFYDVHIILKGSERIQFNYLANMKLSDYDAENDWQKMTGIPKFDFTLEEGEVLLLDPNDAHKTGLIINESLPLKKVVFKLRIKTS